MNNYEDFASHELIIVGAGGHGKVVADMAVAAGFRVLGFVDDVTTEPPLPGHALMGTLKDLPAFLLKSPEARIVLAVGDNRVRKQLAYRLEKALYAAVIHPSAVVSSHAEMACGTVIMPNVVVNASVHVGKHVILNTSCSVDHDCRIGDFAHLSPGVHLAGGVTVGEGAHLGTGACVIPGIKIGEWSIIGAGAVVTKNIPPDVVAVGVPARVIRKLDNKGCKIIPENEAK